MDVNGVATLAVAQMQQMNQQQDLQVALLKQAHQLEAAALATQTAAIVHAAPPEGNAQLLDIFA